MELSILSEETYLEAMNQVVTPALAELVEAGQFHRVVGEDLHYEIYCPEGCEKWVVICHGFTESCVKYRELIWYLLEMNCAVAILDQRGHGYSYRQVPEYWLTHVDRFDDYVEDFAYFIRRIVAPRLNGLPLYAFAHSMGGAVAARTMMEYPDLPVQRMALCSPMIAPNIKGVPVSGAKLLAGSQILLGHGKKRLFMHGTYEDTEMNSLYPGASAAATCSVRRKWYQEQQREDERLQNTAATYQWAYEALRVSDLLLRQENCDKLTLPILLIQAGMETVVRADKQDEFIAKVPNGRICRFPGAKHEIYRSNNIVLGQFMAELMAFYA